MLRKGEFKSFCVGTEADYYDVHEGDKQGSRGKSWVVSKIETVRGRNIGNRGEEVDKGARVECRGREKSVTGQVRK